MISIGLDLSLTHTGYAIVTDDGTVLASGVIKSKPSGDRPVDEIERIREIVQKIDEKLEENCKDIADIVVIEGLAFMARNTSALVQLSGLNYMVRDMLLEGQVPFLIVAPSSLKKFITQKGNADKDMMMMHVYKNYGFEAVDNNENDAYALSVCGLATLGNPLLKLNKPQEEVITLLKKQLQ
jgi:crossover junction endodeoxyribonuclease RuvC